MDINSKELLRLDQQLLKVHRQQRSEANQSEENPASSRSAQFIDFGCGNGQSLGYAASMAPGYGYGIDKSEEAVAACHARGLEARVGDLLAFQEANAAAVTLAINLLPEIGGRAAFEHAVTNLLLCARNFSVIQHSYFDNDGALACRRLCIEGNFSKKIQFKPTVADYVHIAKRMQSALNICGIGIFGLGQAQISRWRIGDGNGPTSPEIEQGGGMTTYRTLRVVIGRKDITRFRAGLRKTGAGDSLFMWERE